MNVLGPISQGLIKKLSNNLRTEAAIFPYFYIHMHLLTSLPSLGLGEAACTPSSPDLTCGITPGMLLLYMHLLTSYASSTIPQDSYGGYMVAFAGRKYAARSLPAFVANSTYTVTSFTLVHEFKKGRLENLYWKRDGCSSCSGNSNFVCLNGQDCAIRTNSCKNRGGNVDCSLGIQLTFSGTDKHESVFNSWYEVKNLRQYSLYGLYSNLRGSLTDQYNKFF